MVSGAKSGANFSFKAYHNLVLNFLYNCIMKKITIIILSVSFAISSFSQERSTLRKKSPNRIILKLGGGVFSNYTYDWDPTLKTFVDNPKFHMDNIIYSGMLGYRSGFNSSSYRFSSTGRDMNRGNVFAVFYQGGSINSSGLAGLDKNEMKGLFEVPNLEHFNNPNFNVRFTELQVGVVWREFLRISGGRGSVNPIENEVFKLIDNFDSKEFDYILFTTGVNLRFGRLAPTLNWTLMSADQFETTISRFDIQICMNMYFWKKILHKDKHLIRE